MKECEVHSDAKTEIFIVNNMKKSVCMNLKIRLKNKKENGKSERKERKKSDELNGKHV